MSVLKIVCYKCKKDMGTKNGGGVEGTTSSLCPKCFTELMQEIEDRFVSMRTAECASQESGSCCEYPNCNSICVDGLREQFRKGSNKINEGDK